MLRIPFILVLCMALFACSRQPVISDEMAEIKPGGLPADFSGSWQRDYAREDHINKALGEAFDKLARARPDPVMRGAPIQVQPSSRDTELLFALARIAELITRPDVLTIVQDDYEIRVDRKDDYSLLCAFFDGRAKATESAFGTETCGWDGDNLVSHLSLPGGLRITYRFTMSSDRQHLRVITTVASRESRVPLTLQRFYSKFDRPAPMFNCIETLSMKRVCSTGELKL
jgi:hypothetical protein